MQIMQQYQHLTDLFVQGIAGQPQAYTLFLQGVAPLLRKMIARKLNPAEVEDVVQEVLLSIHKARHTYDGGRPLKPWLVSITRFRMADHLRAHYAQYRGQHVDIADLEEILADVTEEGGGYESMDNVEKLLRHVPQRQQQILNLMHVEGYTAKEVGQKLQMQESAVKVAAHRAIKKIREAMG